MRDGESTVTRRGQHKLGNVVCRVQLDIFVEFLEHPPEEGVLPMQDDPYSSNEAKDMALARVRSSQ